MSKIKSFYKNNVEKVWYDSSNILYSECVDLVNQLKTLKIVFKNGSMYQYNNVNVNDYLLFRENDSQGKAFFKYIKPYECIKLDGKVDTQEILSALDALMDTNDNNLSKDDLFKQLESLQNTTQKICNELKKFDLSNEELALIYYLINKIMQNLTLSNVTDNKIDFLAIQSIIEAALDKLNDKENSQNTYNELKRILNI